MLALILSIKFLIVFILEIFLLNISIWFQFQFWVSKFYWERHDFSLKNKNGSTVHTTKTTKLHSRNLLYLCVGIPVPWNLSLIEWLHRQCPCGLWLIQRNKAIPTLKMEIRHSILVSCMSALLGFLLLFALSSSFCPAWSNGSITSKYLIRQCHLCEMMKC